MSKLLILAILAFLYLGSSQSLCAHIKKTLCSKKYVKKAQYAGLGKRSIVNGLPKLKGVNGHFKLTSKGYTRVNPYVKSK